MSRQATKQDLIDIAGQLGIAYSGREPSNEILRREIENEFRKLHAALAVLWPDVTGASAGRGTFASQKRLARLYHAADQARMYGSPQVTGESAQPEIRSCVCGCGLQYDARSGMTVGSPQRSTPFAIEETGKSGSEGD